MSRRQVPLHLTLQEEPALLGRCVLMIDEHPPARFNLASKLRDAGAEVRFAGDVREAIFRCRWRLESSQPFDLVIVSLNAARGPEACRQLRENGYRGPILALDAEHDPASLSDAGADAVMPPPADPDALCELAAELTDRQRIADVSETSPTDPPVVSDLAAFPQMHAMLERFVEQLPQQVSAMLDAAAAEDLDRLHELVSQMKRSAGSHGFIDISREAAETERHLHTTADPRHALEPLADLCRRAASTSDHDLPLPPSA